MKLSPLLETTTFRQRSERSVAQWNAYGEQLRLWIPKTEFDLVYGWPVLDGVRS